MSAALRKSLRFLSPIRGYLVKKISILIIWELLLITKSAPLLLDLIAAHPVLHNLDIPGYYSRGLNLFYVLRLRQGVAEPRVIWKTE